MQDVASKLVGDFAKCLGQQMTHQSEAEASASDGDPDPVPLPPAPPPQTAKPLSAFSVLMAAVIGAVKRMARSAVSVLRPIITKAVKRIFRKGG